MMKAWQHFKTITTHKMWVMRYCFKIGLYWQGLTHDLSKYSPTEFLVGMKYYQGDRSPNNAEREDTGMSKSWMHHKGRNKHHFEYWIDYGINCDTIIKGVPMPRRYVAEMIMDRISASRVYLGDAYTDQAPYQYLKKGIGHLWFVHPETLSQLEFLLRMLSERGEDDTLYYIRHHFLKGDPVPRMHRSCKNAPPMKKPSVKKCSRPLIKVLDPPARPFTLLVNQGKPPQDRFPPFTGPKSAQEHRVSGAWHLQEA